MANAVRLRHPRRWTIPPGCRLRGILQQVGTFTDGMTGARGYLALASLIVARLNPFGAAIACLAFGAAEAFELRMQGFGLSVSSYIVQMAPYLIALLVLALLGRASRMPAAIGQPLPRDQ